MSQPCLSCDEVEVLLPLVADGTLDDVGDPALFMHLADCDRCQHSLVTHDLIALSLTQAARVAPLRVRRPRWQYTASMAAAASLVVGAGWLILTPHEQVAAPAPPVARTTPLPAPLAMSSSVPSAPSMHSQAKPATRQMPVDIEVEVVALPGSTTAHPHYLVRRGEQVLVVTPQAAQAEAPSDARPASYSPNRY